jgi:hypothetical protein
MNLIHTSNTSLPKIRFNTVLAFFLDTKKREHGTRQPAYRRPALLHACHRSDESVRLTSLVSADLSVRNDGSKF